MGGLGYNDCWDADYLRAKGLEGLRAYTKAWRAAGYSLFETQFTEPATESLEARIEELKAEIRSLKISNQHLRATIFKYEHPDVVVAPPPKNRKAEAKDIIAEVAMEYGVDVADITGEERSKLYVEPRHEAIRRVKENIRGLSLVQIGKLFNRDHTTILHVLRKATPSNTLQGEAG